MHILSNIRNEERHREITVDRAGRVLESDTFGGNSESKSHTIMGYREHFEGLFRTGAFEYFHLEAVAI